MLAKDQHKELQVDIKYFLKHAICMHLLAYSNFYNLELFGARYAKPITTNNFVTRIYVKILCQNVGQKLAIKSMERR